MKEFQVWVTCTGELIEAVPVYFINHNNVAVGQESYNIKFDIDLEQHEIAGYFIIGPEMKTYQFVGKELFETKSEFMGEL